MRTRKWIFALSFIGTLFFSVGLVVSPLPTMAQENVIGLITPVTGPLSLGGNQVKNGVVMAIEKRPTLFGKPLKLLIADAPDPTAGVSEVDRLVTQHGVKLLLNGYGTPIEGAIQKAAERHKVINIGTVNWGDFLTQGGLKYYFRWTPPVSKLAMVTASHVVLLGKEYSKKEPNQLRVGVIHSDQTSYAADPMVKYLIQNGIQLSIKEIYPADIKDFTSLIMKLRAAKLDILCVCQYASDGLLFRRQMKAINYEPPIMLGQGLIHDEPTFGQLAEAADGVLAVSYTNPEMNPKAAPGLAEFKNEYLKKFGHPALTVALQAYTAVNVFLNEIDKVGSFDAEKITEMLLKADIPPGQTPAYWGFKLDPVTHQNIRAGEPCVIAQWQDGGKYKVVWPEKFAISKLRIPYTK